MSLRTLKGCWPRGSMHARAPIPVPARPACLRPVAHLRSRPCPCGSRPRHRECLTHQELLIMPLNIEPAIAQADDFYEALIDTHRDLTPEQSHLVNAKLILLLANHIGDLDVLREALRRSRDGV